MKPWIVFLLFFTLLGHADVAQWNQIKVLMKSQLTVGENELLVRLKCKSPMKGNKCLTADMNAKGREVCEAEKMQVKDVKVYNCVDKITDGEQACRLADIICFKGEVVVK